MKKLKCTKCEFELFVEDNHYDSEDMVFDCSSCGAVIAKDESGEWISHNKAIPLNSEKTDEELPKMICLQCGCNEIVRNVRVVDRGDGNKSYDLNTEVYENPHAWLFKGVHQGILRANVCPDCGFVMWNVSKSHAQIIKKYH